MNILVRLNKSTRAEFPYTRVINALLPAYPEDFLLNIRVRKPTAYMFCDCKRQKVISYKLASVKQALDVIICNSQEMII